jgi:isoleucyl-tRNA synthetase
MSNFYLDVIKDRLYCDDKNGKPRRAAQSAMYIVLDSLVRMLAPILAFTVEEIWASMPHDSSADGESVLYNSMPLLPAELAFTPEREAMWEKLLRLRADVNKALEIARTEKIIGKPLEAEVTLYISDEAAAAFDELSRQDLQALFIVSALHIEYGTGEGYASVEFPGVNVAVAASGAAKCVRCWTHDPRVGQNSEHPGLCPRCAQVVGRL